MEIRYFNNKDIDRIKWDKLIDSSPQSKIYAFSWYLDSVAKNWDALIGGDYEEVFPLPWNRKLGYYKIVYQPILSQQLGLFTLQNEISQYRLQQYLKIIMKHFNYFEIQLNDACPAPVLEKCEVFKRINLELPLDKDYASIFQGYNVSQIKSLKRSERYNLVLSDRIEIEKIVDIHYDSNKSKIKGYYSSRKKLIVELANQAIFRNNAFIQVVKDPDSNIHVVKLLMKANNRIYNMLGASTPIGRKSVANNFLLNAVIKEYAGTGYILDFEGSMIPGVANFFKGYNATEKVYYYIIYNNLPQWISYLYKIWSKIKP